MLKKPRFSAPSACTADSQRVEIQPSHALVSSRPLNALFPRKARTRRHAGTQRRSLTGSTLPLLKLGLGFELLSVLPLDPWNRLLEQFTAQSTRNTHADGTSALAPPLSLSLYLSISLLSSCAPYFPSIPPTIVIRRTLSPSALPRTLFLLPRHLSFCSCLCSPATIDARCAASTLTQPHSARFSLIPRFRHQGRRHLARRRRQPFFFLPEFQFSLRKHVQPTATLSERAIRRERHSC